MTIDVRYVAGTFRPSRQPVMPWGRVNSLVDGIFGFSATVLMLRLGTPVYEEGHLGDALSQQAPFYVLYGLGFLQIVGTWSVLRRISQWTVGLDFYAKLLAFSTLMMWATIPFTVDVLAEAVGNDDDVASAVRLMASTLLVGMLAFSGLWARLERTGCFREDLDTRVIDVGRVATHTTFVWPVTALLLTWVDPWIALVPYGCAIVLSLLPIEAMTSRQMQEWHG